MDNGVLTAILSLAGTLLGTFGGIVTSNKLTNYRIEQLEEKVNKHNNLVEKMIKVEDSTSSAHKRIDEILERLRA